MAQPTLRPSQNLKARCAHSLLWTSITFARHRKDRYLVWKQSLNGSGLTSSNWLLAYEAEIKGWLPTPAPSFIHAHSRFSVLKQHGVSFYDISKNVKHIRARKPPATSSALAQYLTGTKGDVVPAHVLAMTLIGR